MDVKPIKLFTYPRDKEINQKTVMEFIEKHKQEVERYKYLMNMYKGQAEIFDYPAKDKYKPDNRISVNFAKFIVDTFVGYFNGIPIKKAHSEEQAIEALRQFDNANDMEDEESELAKMTCIYGRCYELVYQNEYAETCVVYNSPEDMFIVYDDSIKQEPLFAVRYGFDEEGSIYGDVYTKESIHELSGKVENVALSEGNPNPYNALQVIEYILNEERMSVFESVVTLINAFNKGISEKSNDVEYFSDQYLAFLGAEINTEDLENIRDNRIINYFGAGGDTVEVKFLDKPDSDAQTENLLDRLTKLIFQTSMVANISDDSFGTSSGTALAYKLEAMSNLALAFQRKFQSALNKRYQLFFSLSTNVPESLSKAWRGIEYTFTRNEPKNVLSEAQTAAQLMGVTSEETALSVLSIVPDVKTELEKKKKETAKAGVFDSDKD